MEPLKRYKIPTLGEIECADKEKEPEPLFKRRKDFSSEGHFSTLTSKSIDNTAVVNLSKMTIIQNSMTSSELSLSNILPKSSLSAIQDRNSSKSIPNEKDISSNGTRTDAVNSVDDITRGPPVVSRPGSSNSLIVNTKQRGNPILKSVRSVPWEYGNIVPDYVMGQSNCALFLSLRYHQLHPNYIHERLKLLGKSYDLRVMLVQVDVKEPHHMLKDLAKICLLADCTLILAFSTEEAGRYLETYKIFENKPPEAIMERTEENFLAKFTDCLTKVKSVNKTDCATLISHFGSLTNIIEAAEEDLSLCPGFGPQKAKRLYNIFHEPFLRLGKNK